MHMLEINSLPATAKWPATAFAAVVVTAALLWLMQHLIGSPLLALPDVPEYRLPEVVLVEREPTPLQRERPVERPKPPAMAPEVPTLEFEIEEVQISLAPMRVAMEEVAHGPADYGARGPIPLLLAPAEYPRSALSRGTEGFVEVVFDVNAAGMPENIRVERSEPSGVFDKNAIRALSKSKFSPVMKNGQAVPFHNLRHRFIFEMETQA